MRFSQRLLLRTTIISARGTGGTIEPFEPHLNSALPHVQRMRVPRSRKLTAGCVGSLRMYGVCVKCKMLLLSCVCILCMLCVFIEMWRKNTPITCRRTRTKTCHNTPHTPKHTSQYLKELKPTTPIPLSKDSKQQRTTQKPTRYHKHRKDHKQKQTIPQQTQNRPVQYHTQPNTHRKQNHYESNTTSKWHVFLFPSVMPTCESEIHVFPQSHHNTDILPTCHS